MEHITFILTLEAKGNVKEVTTFIRDYPYLMCLNVMSPI